MYLIILLVSCILSILFITILKISDPIKQAFLFGLTFVIVFTFYIIINKQTLPIIIKVKKTKKDIEEPRTDIDEPQILKKEISEVNNWKLNKLLNNDMSNRCSNCLEILDITNMNGSNRCIFCSNISNIESFKSELLED